MRRILKRWIAVVLLTALGFAQAGVAAVACVSERGALAGPAAPHQDCDMDRDGGARPSNLCFSHCTADLQAVGDATALTGLPTDSSVRVPARRQAGVLPGACQPAPATGKVPRRILLHSYLV